MFTIDVTELERNFDYYLDMVSREDILITENGRWVAKLIKPNISQVDSITGIFKEKTPVDISRKKNKD